MCLILLIPESIYTNVDLFWLKHPYKRTIDKMGYNIKLVPSTSCLRDAEGRHHGDKSAGDEFDIIWKLSWSFVFNPDL